MSRSYRLQILVSITKPYFHLSVLTSPILFLSVSSIRAWYILISMYAIMLTQSAMIPIKNILANCSGYHWSVESDLENVKLDS